MTLEASMLASVTQALVGFGEDQGVPAERLLAVGGLQAADLEGAETRIARRADTAIWLELSRQIGHDSLGLRFAESSEPAAYGVVALSDMTSPTFGSAMRGHCKHHRLIKDDVPALYIESPSSAGIYLCTPESQRLCAAPIGEAALAPYVLYARAWTGELVEPIEVRFEHARPKDMSRYERIFRCPIFFEQSATSIRFSREVLDLPLLLAQDDLCAYLERAAGSALEQLGDRDLLDAVRATVSGLVASGDTRIQLVARRMGIGVRTLQRRLRDRGVRYQDIVDGVRHHISIQMLTERRESVAEISGRLGFSEPRAFRRAFARWTGMAPDSYRRLRAG